MFGFLVVVFPTRHGGGKLRLRHGEKKQEFDSAKAVTEQASSVVAYAAFFSDVEREVTPVTSGYRATLTYNLCYGTRPGNEDVAIGVDTTIISANNLAFRSAFTEILSDETFMPNGDKLG
jgi:hypothetical protein